MMYTISFREEPKLVRPLKNIRIDCTQLKTIEDAVTLVTLTEELGEKSYVLFIPHLPFLNDVGCFRWDIFCNIINRVKAKAIETYSKIDDLWKENVPRIFSVSQIGFLLGIKAFGDAQPKGGTIYTPACAKDISGKHVLVFQQEFDKDALMNIANELLKKTPRTINLACTNIKTIENQRFSLQYFDRVFLPELPMEHYVRGVDQIYYGENE